MEMANIRSQVARTITPAARAPVSGELSDRLHAIRTQIEDARTALPTGKIFGQTAEGQTIAIGKAKSIREQLSPLFPELRDLPDVGPKEIVQAIDKDRGNKLFLAIRDAVNRQLAKEQVESSALAARPSDFDQFSQAVESLAAQERQSIGGVPIREGRISLEDRAALLERQGFSEAATKLRATQPRMFDVEPTLSPKPLTGDISQVPQEELLSGFKKPVEEPRLPLGQPTPEITAKPEIVELHAGLPIPQSVRKAVRDFFTPLAGQSPEKQSHFYNSARTILNRTLGGGLGDKLVSMRNLHDRFAGEYANVLRATPLSKLTAAEEVNLMRAVEGRARPMNQRVLDTMTAWKNLTNQDATLLTKNGAQVLRDAMYDTTTGARLRDPQWKPFQAVPNYYFRSIDDRLVAKLSPSQLHSALTRANPKLTAQDISEIAAGLQAQAKGQGIPATVGENAARLLRRGQAVTPHLHERSGLNIPDEILLRPKEAMLIYAKNMANEKAALLTYGPKDAAIETAIKGLQTRPRPDARLAVETWDRLRGRYMESPTLIGVDQIQRILGNTATAMLLGAPTAVKQLSQVGMAAAQLPIRSMAVGLAKAFTKKGRFEARRFGAMVDDISYDLIGQRGVLEGAQPSATWLDLLERGSKRAASVVVEKTGITKLDAFARAATFHAAKYDLLSQQQAALAGKSWAVKALRQSNLNATSSLDDVLTASKKIADRVNLRTDPIDLPVFLYKPGLTFIRQLNSFNIAVLKRITEDFVIPLGEAVVQKNVKGTATALGRIVKLGVAMGITGEILADTLRTMGGRPEDRPGGTPQEFANDLIAGTVPAKIFLARLIDNLLTSGLFGYLQNVKEAMLASGGPRESQARLLSTVVGAGVSNIGEVAAHAANVAVKEVTGTETQRQAAREQAARAAARRIPGVGAFAAQLAPASEGSDRRRALEAIVRAQRRGDYTEADEWRDWFEARQGKALSERSVTRREDEYEGIREED